jgi:HSP20 family protein
MPDELTRRPRGGDLFPEMVPLRTMMDRLFESAFTTPFWREGRLGLTGDQGWLGMDVDEDDEAVYVRYQLPGIDPKDVNITVQDNLLTIDGETRRTTPEGRRSVSQGITYGRFQRQFTLGSAVDSERAEANYQDGVLEIRLPKTEAGKRRTIQVKSGGGAMSGASPQQSLPRSERSATAETGQTGQTGQTGEQTRRAA